MTTYEDYRVPVWAISEDLCAGRRWGSDMDTRWSPAILYEAQCSRKPAPGDDLCPTCRKAMERYARDPKPGRWIGRITEPIYDWVHMYGTKWFRDKCRWKGAGPAAKDSSD